MLYEGNPINSINLHENPRVFQCLGRDEFMTTTVSSYPNTPAFFGFSDPATGPRGCAENAPISVGCRAEYVQNDEVWVRELHHYRC